MGASLQDFDYTSNSPVLQPHFDPARMIPFRQTLTHEPFDCILSVKRVSTGSGSRGTFGTDRPVRPVP